PTRSWLLASQGVTSSPQAKACLGSRQAIISPYARNFVRLRQVRRYPEWMLTLLSGIHLLSCQRCSYHFAHVRGERTLRAGASAQRSISGALLLSPWGAVLHVRSAVPPVPPVPRSGGAGPAVCH